MGCCKSKPSTTATTANPLASAETLPEDAVDDPYATFDAVNCLLGDKCVGLVHGQYLLSCEGPIDARQNVPRKYTHYGPLEVGDQRHDASGALMPKYVVITLSYAWAPVAPFYGQPGNEDGTKDHPDPQKYYLLIVQRVLGHMFRCDEYKNDVARIVVFWDWMVLFQNYSGDIVTPAARTAEQKKKFDRCMNSMHLWYGSLHMHIWMMTKTPEYNAREYGERGWCVRDARGRAF